jgi:uncharacterized protein (DUF1800 family)
MADASIALNRFGIGARPDESPPDNPKAWLLGQFDRFEPSAAPIAAVADSHAVAAELADAAMRAQQLRGGPRRKQETQPGLTDPNAVAAKNVLQAARREARQDYIDAVGARMASALATPAPFVERMVWFWANHFAVSIDKGGMVGLAGPFEFEAIRPHVLGRFGDMVNAVERHPAMLLYLDQARSIGPNSPVGQRIDARGKRKVGINENLGREAMELHTLGVRTGYSQADVTEFARALTGWTVVGKGNGFGAQFAGTTGRPGDFVFAGRLHEPGVRTIRGKRYAQPGERQAQAVFDDLVASPATAKHIAFKLARHFAGDTPPQPLVDRLAATYIKTKGDLPSLYRVLIDSPEAWAPAPAKFKTPWEWSVSSLRAVGTDQVKPKMIDGLLNQLGQPVWKPGSPAGYDDIAASWAGPDAILRRVEVAQRFAAPAAGTLDARSLAATLYPAAVSPATSEQLARADSPAQALALLLVAPESMRR